MKTNYHKAEQLEFDFTGSKAAQAQLIKIACYNRTCGASDCPTCYPSSYMRDDQPEDAYDNKDEERSYQESYPSA